MMTLSRQFLVVIPLSCAAGWAGMLLAQSNFTEPSHAAIEPTSRMASDGANSGTPAAGRKGDKGVREIITSSSSAVLWEWLAANSGVVHLEPTRFAVLRELYAREGIGVWNAILAGQDQEARENLSNDFLGMLSSSDPWLTYDLFLQNKDSFGKRWGLGANSSILAAASAISADKFIEVMERSGFTDTNVWFTAELPAGFDFAGLVSHLGSSGHMPSGLPMDLVSKWARVSPQEAAEWLAAQPKPDGTSPMRYLLDEEMVYHNTLLGLAETHAPGRDEGLAALSKLPESTLVKSWERLAEKLRGKINPAVLDAATRMGSRDEYLVQSLLETRGQASPDASWQELPEQDRWKAVELAEKRWKEEASSPVDDRARAEWRQRLESAWSGK